MAKGKKFKGKNVMLFLDNKVIALTTSCDMTINANYSKSASKDSGKWDDMDLDNVSYSGSNDSFMTEDSRTTDLAYKDLLTKLTNGTDVPIAFGAPANYTEDGMPEGGWTAPSDNIFTGTVKITSVGFGAPVNGNATLKVSFEGCGALTIGK